MLDTHATSGTLAASTEPLSVYVYDAFDDDVSAAEATREKGSEQEDMGRWVSSGDGSRGSPEPSRDRID